jgi:eukaryotic-like serine/threonine-protein kinase
MAIAPGTRFGRYEVINPLGAGGMGEVYRARDIRLDRHVALKILQGGAAADPAFRERFEREARTISSLSHPNICALFDVGEQDGVSYLVMEHLDGETLAARLTRGRMSQDEALQCAIQMADGLGRAHASGIVHRDLKPGNIMLLDGGIVKILDFGIAKRFVSDPDDATVGMVSEMGVMTGTVAYMSPEQALGGLVDHRSDIFALGVVLYEMLAGVRPFGGSSAFSVMQRITAADPPEIETHGVSLPAPLQDLLERLLAKSPGDRPQSAQAVAGELRAIVGQAAAGGSMPLPGRRAGSRRRQKGLRLMLVAAVPALVLLAFGLPSVRERATHMVRGEAVPAASGELPPATSKSAFGWVSEGRAHLQRFDRRDSVERALQAFERALEVDPAHAFAHASLAEAYLRKDTATPDPQWVRQARESAERSVQLDPDLAAAHAALGLVLLRAKQPEEGRASFERALHLDSALTLAHMGMGEYHMSRGDSKAAEEVYRTAAALAPDEWHPIQQLGRSLYAQARYADAASTWEEARARSPDNLLVLRNLGAAYHMLGRTDEAASAFQRALEIEPSATLYSNLGTLRFFQGRYTDAAAAFERAVELNPTFYLYWANMGDAYRRVAGHDDKAREAYQRAISLVRERVAAAPDDPDLRTQLALYLVKSGDHASARDQLQHWTSLPNRSPASHFRALLVHEISGEREEALASLEAALAAGYSITEIRDEPDLARLRGDPRYHRLVAAYEKTSER